jgi:cytochrome c biogenesis protein CcmG/thiol:disulfide interchange protein DsbE
LRRFAVALPLVLFAAFAVALFFGLQRDPNALPSVLIDRPLPAFSLAPLRADAAGLSRTDLDGEVALVNVFASWCTICRIEHPTLMRLTADHEVRIYGVDWNESPAAGLAWLERFGDPYLKTGSDANGRLALDLGVSGAPETFVVDKGGRIRYKHSGAITPEVWRDTLGPLVARLEAEK